MIFPKEREFSIAHILFHSMNLCGSDPQWFIINNKNNRITGQSFPLSNQTKPYCRNNQIFTAFWKAKRVGAL